MDDSKSLLFYIPTCIFVLSFILFCHATDENRKVHIVYMGSVPEREYAPSSHHQILLQKVVEDSSAINFLIRSYEKSFNGFAANLTTNEARKLAGMKEVVSVFPSRILQFQTTRSWDFMGFPETVSRNLSAESDIIVGVIDSGIWPESSSFDDTGFSSPPKKWKGICRGGRNFTCNKKIIGARYYRETSATARDNVGHGSHTASIAAGNIVKDVSFYGLAKGNARGGVPSARIAVYKACGTQQCSETNILAAFDDAIADGVDIITVSLGPRFPLQFTRDSIAIGAFHAMQKGVLTLQSAGNSGPQLGRVISVAPWILSVAASSTDRRIIGKVVLDNGKTLIGNSINSFSLNGTKFPLVYGADASKTCPNYSAEICNEGCLDSSLVKGKILLCDFSNWRIEADNAGALGSIFRYYSKDIPVIVPSPALSLSYEDFNDLVNLYMNSTRKPLANILKSEDIKDPIAPIVASFSSRGPNVIVLDILKPDISAPGIAILAAYPPIIPPTHSPHDKRQVKYNMLSGTSMACPHAAGVAAYIKTFHSDWSPSAIKSAIMTTARPMNTTKNSDGEFAYGSGHINPMKAINPGLVYETLKGDYIEMLCSIGYDTRTVRLISGDDSSCPDDGSKVSPKDLNYPSMTAAVSTRKSFTIVFNRTVTNVGLSNSSYTAKIFSNSKLLIKAVPEVLSFNSINEKKSFLVTVIGDGLPAQTMISASLIWSDGTHSVRSPIIVHTIKV